MEETIDVIFNVQFDFALEVWFSIDWIIVLHKEYLHLVLQNIRPEIQHDT